MLTHPCMTCPSPYKSVLKDASHKTDQSSSKQASTKTITVFKDLLLAVPGALSSALFPPVATAPQQQSDAPRPVPATQQRMVPESTSSQSAESPKEQDTFFVNGFQVPVTRTRPEDAITKKLSSPSFRPPSLQDPLCGAACMYYVNLPPNSPKDVLRNAGEMLGALRASHGTAYSPLPSPAASPSHSSGSRAWLAAEREEGLGSERSSGSAMARVSGSSGSCCASPAAAGTAAEEGGVGVVYDVGTASAAAAFLPGLDVRLLRVTASPESGTVSGELAVRPGGHTQEVAVRYTLDNWRSYQEAVGRWQALCDNKGANRYTFTIDVAAARAAGQVALHTPNDGEADLECAVRLLRLGSRQPQWDNAGGSNYRMRIKLPACVSL